MCAISMSCHPHSNYQIYYQIHYQSIKMTIPGKSIISTSIPCPILPIIIQMIYPQYPM